MKNSSPTKNESKGLGRQLGLFDSTMMMVGIVIGSGIFLTTGIMASDIPSPGLILLVWAVGGLLILTGALTYAELGASLPEAGGQYVYLREAYGPLFGFLFGWKMFLVNMSGSIAALGVAFAEYFGVIFPTFSTKNIIFSSGVSIFGKSFTYSLSMGHVAAIGVILALSAFNYIGARLGKIIQNILTVIKLGTIVGFIVLGFTAGKGTPVNFSINPTGMGVSQLIFGFGIAFIAVFWAFDGWNNINYIAGEIKNPKRNLTYALVLGTLVITVLYILINYIYLYALSIDEMAGVVTVAEKATQALYGTGAAGGLITAVVLISVLGALNGAIFVGSRVYYAMAKDKLFFQRVGKVHPKFRTPAFSILIQAVWACVLAISGTFEQLFTFAMFVGILFWVAAAASVFTLRKKYPTLPRPYKTWGYPVTPMIFIVALSGILLNGLIKRPVESLIGIGLTLMGIPVYYLWKRKK